MSPESDITMPSPASFRLRWDVFLSFRGSDTREAFTEDLHGALEAAGVRAFIDNEGLQRGDSISPSLVEAIADSAAAIVILSPDYASSHWCLEELAKICECGWKLVLPVFYRVDPSHVRKQKGPFEKAFRLHEESERFRNKVASWRSAMNKVGGIAGWVFGDHNSNKDQLIRVLVQTVLKQMRNTPLTVAQYTVGLDDRVAELRKLVDVRSSDVKVIGLYGMGGVGKTTLAKGLFNSLVDHFDRRSFISNVREVANNEDGMVSLQGRILGDLSPGTENPINDVNAGISAIKRIVEENRVLVFLDDVDDVKQLDSLIGKREWFSKGSCVVITTRDRAVLQERYVNVKYEVKELKESQALELFCYHSMRRKVPADGFLNLSQQIVSLTGGLPLALEVFGSFLFDKRTINEWKDTLLKLKDIRPDKLQGALKISFDALDEQDKCVFLDIACLFVQMEMKRDDVVDILNGCGFRGEIAITVLTTKCLIKIIKDGVVWMHDQVRDMGRQIVQNQSILDCGSRSRLWDRHEILGVLKNKKGTRKVEGIVLDCVKRSLAKPRDRTAEEITWDNFRQMPGYKTASTYMKAKYKNYVEHRGEKAKKFTLDTKDFQPMVSLRLLQINYSRLEGQGKFLPQGVKWLQWKQCPLKNMSSSYYPLELAVLDLSESKIETLWGKHHNKVAECLMVLNLSSCHHLVAIPDLTGYHCLKKIVLENCTALTRIHESVGNLSTLVHLNLGTCYNLVELPSDVSGLKHLEDLILSGCWKLKALPKDLSCLVSLRKLLIDETAITVLPDSIFHLTKLEKLSCSGCRLLRRIPTSIGKLCSLRELSLNHTALDELPDSIGCLQNLEKLGLVGCKSLSIIPDSVGTLISLTHLFLDVSGIKELPDSIGSLSYLRQLSVSGCTSLGELPMSIKALVSLVELHLDKTPITILPEHIGAMKMLQKLEMANCKDLKFLPASIGDMSALTALDMYNTNITELPESIGMLENLIHLRIDMCKELKRLPKSLGNLKSLCWLQMKETAVTQLPDSFGMLSRLVKLDMERRYYLNMVEDKNTEEPNSVGILRSFCKLTLLQELNAHGWRIAGKIPDDFEKLSSLETLNLCHNNIISLPASMRGLSCLKKLLLSNCTQLIFLPSLPSSLVEVDVANCIALERISDISNLDNIEELNLTNCEKLEDIPGIEHLKSLRRLYMSGCIGCSHAAMRRFSKDLLKNLRILIMPGSKDIPDWISGESIIFSKRRNRELKGIICAGVLSFDGIPENQRDALQIVDVQAKVFNLTDNVYSTTFRLLGVPRTNEDHIFLHRFGAHTSLVHQLKDKYTLHLTKRNAPFVQELKLKNCGIHLVFEGDDDYEGDEESLDESQYSVSQKLAKFFNSCYCPRSHLHVNTSTSNEPLEIGRSITRSTVPDPWLRSIFFSAIFLCALSYLYLRYLDF
ncbi:disease resistance protein RPV1-like isoform X1 [Arachis stenosperma]|uniref:disease resistance protein RPV1-like isoform X1 n=1 Tax=Arachis stenosperma TaxID=217475 RepID=UPI0025ABBDB9|nr:disease resistance protein RPV1-like isoform X1 [Arachis stenosperma]